MAGFILSSLLQSGPVREFIPPTKDSTPRKSKSIFLAATWFFLLLLLPAQTLEPRRRWWWRSGGRRQPWYTYYARAATAEQRVVVALAHTHSSLHLARSRAVLSRRPHTIRAVVHVTLSAAAAGSSRTPVLVRNTHRRRTESAGLRVTTAAKIYRDRVNKIVNTISTVPRFG